MVCFHKLSDIKFLNKGVLSHMHKQKLNELLVDSRDPNFARKFLIINYFGKSCFIDSNLCGVNDLEDIAEQLSVIVFSTKYNMKIISKCYE